MSSIFHARAVVILALLGVGTGGLYARSLRHDNAGTETNCAASGACCPDSPCCPDGECRVCCPKECCPDGSCCPDGPCCPSLAADSSGGGTTKTTAAAEFVCPVTGEKLDCPKCCLLNKGE